MSDEFRNLCTPVLIFYLWFPNKQLKKDRLDEFLVISKYPEKNHDDCFPIYYFLNVLCELFLHNGTGNDRKKVSGPLKNKFPYLLKE